MVQQFVWAEPFLELFIPNAACLECSHCGGFPGVDVVALLDFVGPCVVVEWTEALWLMVQP